MNRRFLSVLLFAFAVAAGASLMLYRLLAHRMEIKPAAAVQQVILAARNLEPGTLLRDQDLKAGPWSGVLPAGALTKKEDIIGRGVVAAIVDNEPILASRLAARGAGAGLASMIPAGMRAVALRVNEVVGVAGFVVPGMRVDVLISGNPPAGDNHLGNLTKTLLQNIEVLSAGQDIKKDAEGKPVSVPVVNLLVIQLVLRNPLDTRTTETPGAAMAQLFGPRWMPPSAPRAERIERPRPPAPVRPAAPSPVLQSSAVKPRDLPPLTIETLHGGKRTQTKFQEAAQ
jgi:pilus assembly protein CpaB